MIHFHLADYFKTPSVAGRFQLTHRDLVHYFNLERNHMELLIPVWLPILLSATAIWVISAIFWMALPHHKQDFIGLPDEDSFMDYIRRSGIKPGNYVFPDFRGREAMKSEKDAEGLEGRPGRPPQRLADAGDYGRQDGRHLHRLPRRQHPHRLPHA